MTVSTRRPSQREYFVKLIGRGARTIAVLSVLLSFGTIAYAAYGDLSISPAAPLSNSPITGRVELSGPCSHELQTVVNGSTITTNVLVTGCVAGPPGFTTIRTTTFGPLPPGPYVWIVTEQGPYTPPQPIGQFGFAVTSAGNAIPTLEHTALMILAFLLVTIAVLRARA
jgi:hypothetical protein